MNYQQAQYNNTNQYNNMNQHNNAYQHNNANQYNNVNQINNMDYWSLVQALSTQISPQYRAVVLSRLTEMNNQLLLGNQSNIQMDLARAGSINSRKKDANELSHPSFDHTQYRSQQGEPRNSNFDSMRTSSSDIYKTAGLINIPSTPATHPTHSTYSTYPTHPTSSFEPEINIDDIIDDLDNKPQIDNLDQKLYKIKNLHSKILTDKRNRRKEKNKQN